jgi:hypothetical protein
MALARYPTSSINAVPINMASRPNERILPFYGPSISNYTGMETGAALPISAMVSSNFSRISKLDEFVKSRNRHIGGISARE